MTSQTSEAAQTSTEIVQKSLFNLLESRGLGHVSEDSIDDIVLTYVVSLVEDLTVTEVEDKDESALDLDGLVEMLTAYIPGTENIPEEEILKWMFQVADDLKQIQKKETKVEFDIKSVIEETTNKKPKSRTPKTSESDVVGQNNPMNIGDLKLVHNNNKSRINRLSETSDGGSEASSSDGGEDFQLIIRHLQEMFPYACNLEINHCLNLGGGEVETAAQLIMHRHEVGQSLRPMDNKRFNKNNKKVDEKVVKERILGKYGFVDQEEDKRYHRPTLKKSDDKKLIRYRDGKIVSTKGERFTQMSKEESEEMKKSIRK